MLIFIVHMHFCKLNFVAVIFVAATDYENILQRNFPDLQYDAIYELSPVEGPQIKMSHESLPWES